MKVCEMPDGAELQLLSKVGFDGSSSQSVYKQACGDEEENLKIEENLFLTCMVPIQLKDVKTGNVLWTNAKTSSTLYTRPVSFKYCKENKVNIDELIEIRLLQKINHYVNHGGGIRKDFFWDLVPAQLERNQIQICRKFKKKNIYILFQVHRLTIFVY